MSEEKAALPPEIDTKNITAIAQYIVDGSLVVDAGDLLRIIILRVRPIMREGNIVPTAFPVVEIDLTRIAAERLKADIEKWLETEIKDSEPFLLKFDLLSAHPKFEKKREIPLERLELAIMSESSLKKDWLTPEEDDTWADL